MARKEAAAIKKYSLLLPDELSKRYGGAGLYTEAQVRKTVDDLSLDKNHINYALLLFCEQEVLTSQGVEEETISTMLAILNKAADGGFAGGDFASSSVASFLGNGDNGDGSGCDGGGGGGE